MAVVATAVAGFVGSLGASTAVAAAIGSLAVNLLATVAISALTSAFTSEPDVAQPGIKTEHTQTGGTTPASFVLGNYSTGGQFMAPPMSHGVITGAWNAYLTYVIEVSDLPGVTLDGLIINGERAEITTTVHPEYGTELGGVYAGTAWFKYYDGTQTAADPMLLAKYPVPYVRPWQADMVGEGIAYAILTFQFNRSIYSGFPRVRFEVGQMPLYDPRKDSTAGGSGTHRWNDPASWEPSTNPAVQAYNIFRGIRIGPDVWGGQYEAEDLPFDNWITAMNACDVDVDGEPMYRSSIEVYVNQKPWEILEEIGRAAAMEFAEVGGKWRVRVGGPGLPVYFFSDDDVLISEGQRYEPFPSQVYRGVHASYPDPEAMWESREAPPRYAGEWVADDDIADLTLPAAPYPNQVQRLQMAYLREEERHRRHMISLPPDASVLEPLDVVAWTSARNSYANKSFEVASITVNQAHGICATSLREKDSSDFVPQPGDPIPSPAPSPGTAYPPPQVLPGFDLQAVAVVDAASSDVAPGLRIAWNSLEDMRGVAWEYHLVGGTQVFRGSVNDVSENYVTLTEGVLPDATYAARAIPVMDRTTDWTPYQTVTTPDLRPGFADLDPGVSAAVDAAQQAADDANLLAIGAQADHDALVAGFSGNLVQNFTALESRVAGDGNALPSDFSRDSLHWTSDIDIDPDTVGDTTAEITYVADATYGRLASLDVSGGSPVLLGPKQVMPCLVGRTYRITGVARLKGGSIPAGDHMRLQFRGQDASYAQTTHDSTNLSFTALNSWQTFQAEFTVPNSAPWNTTPWLRFLFFKINTFQLAGGEVEVRSVRCEDITGEANNTGLFEDIVGLDISPTSALGVLKTQLQVDAGGNSAWVANTASALATVEGNMSAAYSLGVGAGGASAGLFLFASDDMAGSPASGVAIRADQMTVSAGRNLLTNTDFSNGLANWALTGTGSVLSESTLSVRTAGSGWAGTNYPTLMVYQGGTGSTGYSDLRYRPKRYGETFASGIPCKEGDVLEFSAKISNHRCTTTVYIYYYDTTGSFLTAHTLYSGYAGQHSSSNPASWPTRWGVGSPAPANTAYATLVFRKSGTDSGSNSYMFVHEPQLTFGHANQLEPTPYAQGGVTLITNDGLVTGSVTADKMVTGTITAASGVLATAAVETLTIAGNAVTVPVRSFTAGALTLTSSWQTAASVTLNRKGVATWLDFVFDLEGDLGSTYTGRCDVRIIRAGGGQIGATRTFISGTGGPPNSVSMVLDDPDTGTGSTTYTVEIKRNITTWAPATAPIARNRALIAIQYQR